MARDHRVTLNRRHAYRTTRNRTKTIRTPGGKYAVQYLNKQRKGVLCGDCKLPLSGIKHMDANGFKTCHRRQKTVARPYGGSRCGQCVRERVIRAFLIEEQKIVKKVLAEKSRKNKKSEA